jgi:hypothetical protein
LVRFTVAEGTCSISISAESEGLTSIAGHGAANDAGGEVCGLGNAATEAEGGRQE